MSYFKNIPNSEHLNAQLSGDFSLFALICSAKAAWTLGYSLVRQTNHA